MDFVYFLGGISFFFFFFFYWGLLAFFCVDSSCQKMNVLRFHPCFCLAKTVEMVVGLAEDNCTFSDVRKSLVNWIF